MPNGKNPGPLGGVIIAAKILATYGPLVARAGELLFEALLNGRELTDAEEAELIARARKLGDDWDALMLGGPPPDVGA